MARGNPLRVTIVFAETERKDGDREMREITQINGSPLALPVKCWAPWIEDSAEVQVANLANHPLARGYIGMMADCHMGVGCPIGSVFALDPRFVSPAAVGSDVSCGVAVTRTSLTEIDRETLKLIMGTVREMVPVGFAHHDKPVEDRMPPRPKGVNLPITDREWQSACHQVGTLGGGE